MITLNSEKGLVQIENWADIESRPGFVRDLDPKAHKLKVIIGRYIFPETIRCGLSNCHTPHAKGYIVVTEDGQETNIGKDCGKTYFGVDFEILSRQFDRDLAAAEGREALASFGFHIESVEARLEELRQSAHGANWVYKNLRPLQATGRGCADEVVRKLAAMVKARNPELGVEREATDAEIDLIESREGRTLERPHYVSDPVAQIAGLEALYVENDLRKMLVIDLETNLAGFKQLVISDLTHTELQRWSKWINTVESTLERASASVEAGRQLLHVENLAPLEAVILEQSNRMRFRAFLRSLNDASAQCGA